MAPRFEPKITEPPLDKKYLKRISTKLNDAFAGAKDRIIDLKTARLVIFSDHHKGTKDGADDFHRCEPAYCAALGHYLEAGHNLYVLGDVEELWENDAGPVLNKYGAVIELEAEFHRRGRYSRFWGNHDDTWSHDGPVGEHLQAFFPGIEINQAMKLVVKDGDDQKGVLFLTHGHQGTESSDTYAWIARPVVRYLWRPVQRKTGFLGQTPAQDFELRAKHDRAMFEWAQRHDDSIVLIAGHTHRPVFWRDEPEMKRFRPPDQVSQELEELRASNSDLNHMAELRAELEFGLGFERNPAHVIKLTTPCYFNTGCCSFGDGDVTGIEIADGKMRLVRWPDDAGNPKPKLLAEKGLDEILAAVRRSPADAEVREVAITPASQPAGGVPAGSRSDD